jgi:hypothetical protein
MVSPERRTLGALLLIISGAFFAVFAWRMAMSPAAPAGDPAPAATSTESRVLTFTHAYSVGYEGVNYHVKAELQHPFPQFTTMKEENAPSRFMLHEGERVHWIHIMSNDGAGFTSPEQAWDEMYKERLCPACAKITPPFPVSDLAGATKLAAYADSNTEVLVWQYNADFIVAARIVKPSTEAENVLRTFKFTYERTDDLLPYQLP